MKIKSLRHAKGRRRRLAFRRRITVPHPADETCVAQLAGSKPSELYVRFRFLPTLEYGACPGRAPNSVLRFERNCEAEELLVSLFSGMSSFRSYVWDPSLLISQMVCMQTIFYTTECAALIAYSVTGFTPTLTQVFSLQALRVMVVVQLLATLSCGVAMRFVIQRAKQCLDFSCTVHVFHLLFVIIYNLSFPTQLLWWGVQIASVVICTLLGEFLCMRAESQEIRLGPPSKYDL